MLKGLAIVCLQDSILRANSPRQRHKCIFQVNVFNGEIIPSLLWTHGCEDPADRDRSYFRGLARSIWDQSRLRCRRRYVYVAEAKGGLKQLGYLVVVSTLTSLLLLQPQCSTNIKSMLLYFVNFGRVSTLPRGHESEDVVRCQCRLPKYPFYLAMSTVASIF